MSDVKEKERQLERQFANWKEQQGAMGNWINNPMGMLMRKQQEAQLKSAKLKLKIEQFKTLYDGAQRYLPELSRKQVMDYLHSPEILKDFMNFHEPGLIIRRLISYAGPPVTKFFQVEAQRIADQKEWETKRQIRADEKRLKEIGIQLSQFPGPKKLAKLPKVERQKLENERKSLLTEQEETSKSVEKMKMVMPWKKTLTPLLNKVPPVPYHIVKKDVEGIIAEYNRKHPGDPIVHLDKKPIGSGSMAQGYKARTRSGTNRFIKVFRPECSEKYLNEYHKFAQFLILFLMGNDEEKYAREASDALLGVFKHEIKSSREEEHADRLRKRVEKDGHKVTVPKVLALTNRGFVEEFVNGRDLAELNDAERQREMQELAPVFVKSFLIYPERYLDPQNGNAKAPAAIFDFGRMGIISDKASKHLQEFMKSVIKLGDPYKVKPEDRKEYEKKRKKAFDKLRPLLTNKKIKNEELRALVQYEILHKSYDVDDNSMDRIKSPLGYQNSHNIDDYQKSELFSVFSNLIKLSRLGKVKQLTDVPNAITTEDISHGRKKLKPFIRPFFQYAEGQFSDEKLVKKLEKMKPKELSKLSQWEPYSRSYYSQYDNDPGLLALASKIEITQGTIKWLHEGIADIDKQEAEWRAEQEKESAKAAEFSTTEGEPNQTQANDNEKLTKKEKRQFFGHVARKGYQERLKTVEKELDKLKKAFNKKRKKVFAKDGEKKGSLVQLARVDKHLTNLANSIVDSLFGKKELSDKKRRDVIDYMKGQLNQEFSPIQSSYQIEEEDEDDF